MDILRIGGGRRLSGEVRLTAAKNAVLPIMAAALMAEGPVTLHDVPRMTDIDSMARILGALGCVVTRRERTLMIDPGSATGTVLEGKLPTQLRSSIFLLGPLLSRFRKAEAVYPGGCAIGKRPIDLHLKGLAALGAKVTESDGRVRIDGGSMHAADYALSIPSVGATENLMMAMVRLSGTSRIFNAAREPEIVDLAGFLNSMGARISGAGSAEIRIEGVKKLSGISYTPIPDRIVGGTMLCAAAITGGEILLKNACAAHLGAVIRVMRNMGMEIECGRSAIRIRTKGTLLAQSIATAPFPGFPTDLQAPMMAVLCRTEGLSRITEQMFENRFQQVDQLRRMGAEICLCDRTALIQGSRLHGANLEARDLRCGAALVLAALGAEGSSEVRGVGLIDRGYERLEAQIAALGGDIRRIRRPE